VRETQEREGLGIRDPSIMNLALGKNIIWRIIIGKYDWWKSVLHKKLFL
jgi:hypothetical protein